MNEGIYRGCRICGYDDFCEDELPWGKDGKTPSYDLCPCCGCEFGYDDYEIEDVKNYRNKWYKNNNKWDVLKAKPINWSLEEQIKKIPKKYL